MSTAVVRFVFSVVVGVISGKQCVLRDVATEKKDEKADTFSGLRLDKNNWPPKVNRKWFDDASRYKKANAFWKEANAPEVIIIDRGRQLFVDNYLIDENESKDWKRKWFKAKLQSTNIIKADEPWERRGVGRTARPFGAGIRIDQRRKRAILWYRCGWRAHLSGQTCAAISNDGITFTKPSFATTTFQRLADRASNIVIKSLKNEACEIEYDYTHEIFRALRMEYSTGGRHYGPYKEYSSDDGIHWLPTGSFPIKQGGSTIPLFSRSQPYFMADRSSFFYNPLRINPVWILSLRENMCKSGPSGHMRIRRYAETPVNAGLMPRYGQTKKDMYQFQQLQAYLPIHNYSYFQCREPNSNEPTPWLWPTTDDCNIGFCDLYAVDAIAYESVLLFSLIFLNAPYIGGELKNNSIHLGFSRDGFHISRPKFRATRRRPFITPPHTFSNIQMATGSPLIFGTHPSYELLYFYFGFGTQANFSLDNFAAHHHIPAIHSNFKEGTGLAILRRDGFAAIEPETLAMSLVTKPIIFFDSHRFLFLNLILDSPFASLTIEFIHAINLCPFSDISKISLKGPINSTAFRIPDVTIPPLLQARRFRLRFFLERNHTAIPTQLFAFWFSPTSRGSSHGFLAGGSLRTFLL